MNKRDDQFLPERVDEQVDALSRSTARDRSTSPEARLVSDLHHVYSAESEIAEQVWARLTKQIAAARAANAEQEDAKIRPRQTQREDRRKGPQTMQAFHPEKPQRKRRSRTLETLVAVLIIAVLVGSMAVLFKTRQSSLAGKGTPTAVLATPTPSPTPPPVISQGGLYVTTSNGIERINLVSGKVVWHSGSGTTDSLLVYHGIVVFAGGDTFGGSNNYSNYYIEAVNATTGKQIWRKPYPGIIYPLQGANGAVYVSSCGAADTATCSIDALKVSNGNRLWSHSSALGTIWELYQDGVVFGLNYSRFFALNAANGAVLWQKTLQKYPYQEATMTPVVSGKELYFATCNETKQTPTYQSCYFFAFNATSGEELWHIPLGKGMNNNILALPTAMDGVVYAASLGGVIHALDARTGASLWSYATSGQIVNPLFSSQGLLYAEVQNTTSTRLLALSHPTPWPGRKMSTYQRAGQVITSWLWRMGRFTFLIRTATSCPSRPRPATRHRTIQIKKEPLSSLSVLSRKGSGKSEKSRSRTR